MIVRTVSSQRRDAILCLAATIAIVVATYLSQLGAPLELQDDHRIIAPLIAPHPAGAGGALSLWSSAILTDIREVGRFRPVNQIFDVIGPLVLGPSALVWHTWLLLLAGAVAALLYVTALRVWHSPIAASAFALIAMLAPDPGPTAAWYRLGPKEAWGMFLLAAALASMVREAGRSERRFGFVSFPFVVLAACSKESFVLLVPALFGVRLWLDVRASHASLLDAFRHLRTTAVAYAVLFFAGILATLFVIRSAGSRSYGGQSLSIPLSGVTQALARDLARTPSLSVWFVPVLLAGWVVWRRRENARPYLLAVIVFVAWAGPQFALYATRGGMWDHYWIPCILALAAVNAAAIEALARDRQPIFYRLAVCVFALWLINAVRIDITAVRNFKEKARVQQEAVRIAAGHLEADSMLVIIADGKIESERAPSFADFVNARGGTFRRALLYDTRCSSQRCPLLDLRSGEILNSVDENQIGVIVHLDGTDAKSPAALSWYHAEDFQRERAAGDYQFLSLRNRGWVAAPFSIPIDVRKAGLAGKGALGRA